MEPNWLTPMDTMADEWDLMKDWAFGTVKRTRLLILPSSNTCLTKHLFKSAQSQDELDATYERLTERQDDEGIKLLDGRTQNNLHWFTSGDDSNKKISQILVQTHKNESYDSVFDPPYSNS